MDQNQVLIVWYVIDASYEEAICKLSPLGNVSTMYSLRKSSFLFINPLAEVTGNKLGFHLALTNASRDPESRTQLCRFYCFLRTTQDAAPGPICGFGQRRVFDSINGKRTQCYSFLARMPMTAKSGVTLRCSCLQDDGLKPCLMTATWLSNYAVDSFSYRGLYHLQLESCSRINSRAKDFPTCTQKESPPCRSAAI